MCINIHTNLHMNTYLYIHTQISVNYPFIMAINPHTELGYDRCFRLASYMTLIFLVNFGLFLGAIRTGYSLWRISIVRDIHDPHIFSQLRPSQVLCHSLPGANKPHIWGQLRPFTRGHSHWAHYVNDSCHKLLMSSWRICINFEFVTHFYSLWQIAIHPKFVKWIIHIVCD